MAFPARKKHQADQGYSNALKQNETPASAKRCNNVRRFGQCSTLAQGN